MQRRTPAAVLQHSRRGKEVGRCHQRNHSTVGEKLPNAEEGEQQSEAPEEATTSTAGPFQALTRILDF